MSNDASMSVFDATERRIGCDARVSSACMAYDENSNRLSRNRHAGSAASVMFMSLHSPSASLSQVSSHHFIVTRSLNQ